MSINFSSALNYAGSLSAGLANRKTDPEAESKNTPAATSDNAAAASAKDAAATTDASAVTANADADEAQSQTDDSATGIDAKSILKEFRKAMNDQLLKGLGLGSMEELQSAMAAGGVSSFSMSVQFELSYQSFSSVSGAATGSSLSLSLSASFELTGVASGLGAGFNPFATGESDSANGTNANDPLATLRDLFSPEKTAQRILDFSLSFFGQSSMFREQGDTEEGRSAFADMMGKAIQKGFDQAMGILGDVPHETASEIDQTHQLVFAGLDDFIQNGRKSEKDGLFSQIQDYVSAYQYSASYSSLTSTLNTADGTLSTRAVSMQASYQHVQSSYSAKTPAADSSNEVTA